MVFKRINVTVTEKAFNILKEYQEKKELKSRDEALNMFLLNKGK